MARHHAAGGSHDTARPRSGPTGNAARTARVSAVGGVAHVSCVMLTEVLSPGARPPDATTSRGPLSTQRHRSRSQRAPRAPTVLQLRCSQRQIATPGAARAPRIHRVPSAWPPNRQRQCIWSVRAIPCSGVAFAARELDSLARSGERTPKALYSGVLWPCFVASFGSTAGRSTSAKALAVYARSGRALQFALQNRHRRLARLRGPAHPPRSSAARLLGWSTSPQ